jgi:glucuronosyltransferase
MVNSRKYLPFFLLSLTLGDFASSVNILFFLGGGNFSHKLSIWPLVIKLTEQGHNVTFISSNAKQPLKNSKVYDLAPAFLVGETEQYYAVDRLQIRKERKEGGLWTAYDQSTFSFCNLTLNSKDDATMNNLIENGKFDLVIVNSILGECGFLLAHHFGAKHVVFDSTTIIPSFHGIYGIPIEASWVPDMKSQENYPMGLVERMKNVYNYFVSYERTLSFKKNMMELYKDRFNLDTTPDFTEIERNTSLVLVNSHHTIDFARSLPPMFVSIGGMQCWQPQGQLPKVCTRSRSDEES